MGLTPKQEKFCQCVAGGMTYKDAYNAAYDTNGSDRAALNEGSKLALREDIQARISTLLLPVQKAVQTESLNARQKQIDFILERIAICKEKDDEQSIIRYTDMLNKLYNLYKDSEQEQNKPNTLNKIDSNALKRIVNG